MGFQDITQRHVRVALCHLGHDRAPGATPLADLAVVRARLRAAGFDAAPDVRCFELGRLLHDLVERELLLRRQRAAATAPEGATPAERIRADFRHDHRELEALSAIYHLYVRSDLGLGLDAFVALLGDRHRRTVQRRLELGVAMITHRLRDLERDAALAERRRDCLRGLPPAAEAALGAEVVVARVASALAAAHGRPIALGGIGGIGKTTVARAAALRLMDQGVVGEVAWHALGAEVEGPRAVREVGHWPHEGDQAVRRAADAAAAAPSAALVVVDGLDHPSVAFPAARALLARAAVGPVLLVGRVGWAGAAQVDALNVPPLPRDAAARLLHRAAGRRGVRLADPVGTPDGALGALVAATAGVPAAVERAADALRVRDAAALTRAFLAGRGEASEVLEAVWRPVWDGAPPDVRRAVRAVLALRAAGIVTRADTVAAHLRAPAERTAGWLSAALDHGLLAASGDPLRPTVHPLPLLARFLDGIADTPRAA